MSTRTDTHSTRYNPRQRRFEYKQANGTSVVLRGVHPTLQELVWPHYSFERATFGQPPPEYRVDSTQLRHNARGQQPRTARQGEARGSRVDAQLTKICNWIGRYDGVTTSTFLVRATRVPTSINPRVRNAMMRLRRSLHPYTTALLRHIHQHRWTPIGAQIAVGNPLVRLGTAIDVLCVRATRHGAKYVVLEIKCGFDRYYFHHSQWRMTHPFDAWNDSCYHQHQLQLMATTWLFERCASRLTSEAYVLRAHRSGVSQYPLLSSLRTPTYTRALQRLLLLPRARGPTPARASASHS